MKQWQIWEEQFNKFLPNLQKILLSQIWDPRFEKIWDYITKKELDTYLKDWLITKELHTQCINKLEKVEKLREEKENKVNWIKSDTKISKKFLMSKI